MPFQLVHYSKKLQREERGGGGWQGSTPNHHSWAKGPEDGRPRCHRSQRATVQQRPTAGGRSLPIADGNRLASLLFSVTRAHAVAIVATFYVQLLPATAILLAREGFATKR